MAKDIKEKIKAALSTTELAEVMDEWCAGLQETIKKLPSFSAVDASLTLRSIRGVFDQAHVKWEALAAFEWHEDVRPGKGGSSEEDVGC